jgi:OOP family OmpA-OmpF porin
MSKTSSTRGYLLILAGLLTITSAHADKMPDLWGPKAVSPLSLHVPEQQTAVAEESFKYVPLHPVLFNSGKATLSHEGQQALDAAADYLLKHDNIKRILVEGNTDYIGNNKYNDRLSDRRTEMVRNYLTLKGVDPTLIVLTGKGETTPVDQNWTREGRQRNRHVAIHAVHWQR